MRSIIERSTEVYHWDRAGWSVGDKMCEGEIASV